MKWNIGTKIIAGFAVALIALIALSIASYVSLSQLKTNNGLVAHTYIVLQGLEEVISSLKDAETGQRGYLITGQDRYLDPFNAALPNIKKSMTDVRELTKDNPAQQQRLEQLQPLIDAKLAELQETIDLRRNTGFDAALQVVITDKGKKTMDDIRAVVDAMEKEENGLMVTRDAASINSYNTTNAVLVGGTLIALFISIIVGIFITRGIVNPLKQMTQIAQQIADQDVGSLVAGLKAISSGDFTQRFTVQSQAITSFSGDETGILAQAFNQMIARLQEASRSFEETNGVVNSLNAEMTSMATLQDGGDLDAKIDTNRFKGAYRTMAQGINDMVFGHIAVKRKAMACVAEFGRGNFEAPLEKFPGKKVFINDTIEEVRENLKSLSAETRMLSKAAVEGKLATRANTLKFKGDWCLLVQGMNETLDSVIGPLNVAAAYVDKIAGGVVPAPITDTYNGDFNTLKNNLNRMSDRLREMLTGISDAANNLSSATAEILAATTQQASGASEQSAAISQTTTTVEEVKASSEQAAMRAQDVATASQRTVEVARSGQTSVQATIESMGVIKERVEGISENLLALSDQTQQIGEIIAKVNEIASQSNMLALNASVEAARAGEHGKGFAVVATEVRSLAEQSRQATEQIKAILSEIQKATNSTVMATEEGVKGVDRGVSLSSQSRESIEQLSAVINESAQVAAQVVASGQQQQTGIDQIALAMQNINQVTMQSLASTRQTEKSAQNLNELARRMSEILAQYRF